MRENTRGFRRKTVNLHVELVSDESKGILARIDANKGIGVDNLTPAPSSPLNGQNRELCLMFTTCGCSCTYGNKCNEFHLTEKQFLNFDPAKQAKLDREREFES
jgi:hypothetical protein